MRREYIKRECYFNNSVIYSMYIVKDYPKRIKHCGNHSVIVEVSDKFGHLLAKERFPVNYKDYRKTGKLKTPVRVITMDENYKEYDYLCYDYVENLWKDIKKDFFEKDSLIVFSGQIKGTDFGGFGLNRDFYEQFEKPNNMTEIYKSQLPSIYRLAGNIGIYVGTGKGMSLHDIRHCDLFIYTEELGDRTILLKDSQLKDAYDYENHCYYRPINPIVYKDNEVGWVDNNTGDCEINLPLLYKVIKGETL